MSLKDKLEIGLKPDAPYRQDNLPESQKDDPACQQGAAPGTAPRVEVAREACDEPSIPVQQAGIQQRPKKTGQKRTDGVPPE